MSKFVLRGAWLSTFSRDPMRILCLSLAGRWWCAEWEMGEYSVIYATYLCSVFTTR